MFSKRTLGITLTLLAILPGLVGNFTPEVAIKQVYADSNLLPIDGDAWTENNNATHPWTCSISFPDDIQFVAEDKKVGSYSLRANHTSTTAHMAFMLDLGSQENISRFDTFVFWWKMVRSSYT